MIVTNLAPAYFILYVSVSVEDLIQIFLFCLTAKFDSIIVSSAHCLTMSNEIIKIEINSLILLIIINIIIKINYTQLSYGLLISVFATPEIECTFPMPGDEWGSMCPSLCPTYGIESERNAQIPPEW